MTMPLAGLPSALALSTSFLLTKKPLSILGEPTTLARSALDSWIREAMTATRKWHAESSNGFDMGVQGNES